MHYAVAGLHPLHAARGDGAVTPAAVGMGQRPVQNIGEGGYAPVRMRERPVGIRHLARREH